MHQLGHGGLPIEQVMTFIAEADTDGFLDLIELSARYLENILSPKNEYQRKELGIKQSPADAIAEINYRFRESSFGFSYEGGQIIRIDTEFTHEEMIKPTLRLLSGGLFKGPQSEFLAAHRHYRNGDYPQAIVEAAKSFESTLKAVCELKGWKYEKGSRASDLLKIVRAQQLWPDYLDNSFDQLLATLTSGLPKVRNEEGAHGQGAKVRSVPAYVASYAIHLCAAKILLINEAAQSRS